MQIAQGSTDRERRLAMLVVDNAMELGMKTFLGLRPWQRRGPKLGPIGADPLFYELLDGIEKCFPDWPPGVSHAEIGWLHDLRNTLYHRGNGLAPDGKKLVRYLAVTELVLVMLFTEAGLERAQAEIGLAPHGPDLDDRGRP